MPGRGLELQKQMIEPYPALAGALFGRADIAITSRLPESWRGLRLAILLRSIVTARFFGEAGRDIERWGLRPRLDARHEGHRPYRADVALCR
jgi:hypothetical protein